MGAAADGGSGVAEDDAPLKSAYELAMARLRAQDKGRREPLTAEQKAEIAQLRQEAEAKLAEMQILYRDELTAAATDPAATDPAAVKKIEEHYQVDRRRVESKLESSIERVRRVKQD